MNAIANYIPAPKSIELHLGTSTEFSKYSKKVKALGGTYTECRGNAYKRFVTLPFTDEGRELANRLVAEFGHFKTKHHIGTVVIARGLPSSFRGKHIHAPVVVHYIDKTEADPCGDFLSKYEAAFLRAFPDAVNPEPVVEVEPVDEEALPVHLTLTKAQARIVLAALECRVNELDSDLFKRDGRLVDEAREVYQSIDKQVF